MKRLETDKQNFQLSQKIEELNQKYNESELKYYEARRERDMFKFDLEKAIGVITENKIEIELESQSEAKPGEAGPGLKLIDEYTALLEKQKTVISDKEKENEELKSEYSKLFEQTKEESAFILK
jgi:hypothetical protein